MGDKNISEYGHLEELGGSNYEIIEGEPNIKGWEVKNIDGQKIGEVDELLFDPNSRKVRYLIVDLIDKVLDIDDHKKVLIPIGVVEIRDSGNNEIKSTLPRRGTTDETDDGRNYVHLAPLADEKDEDNDAKLVIVPVTMQQLKELPAYKKNNVTPDTESTIRYIFEGSGPGAANVEYDRDVFYGHDHFNEDKFYNSRTKKTTGKLPVIEENLEIGKREVETGGAIISSRIVERPVEASINLREEHVSVQRTPADRPVSSSDPSVFREEELEITERTEVPVVTKEARVVEEVSFNKEVKQKEEKINETLRKTEIKTEKIDRGKPDADQ